MFCRWSWEKVFVFLLLFFFHRKAETNFLYCSPVLHSKTRTKHLVIYLLQSRQAFTILFADTEALCEKEMLFVLSGAECSWAQGSVQCFTVVLTFKSSQGSCAELLKITNSHLYCWHSWPWTIIIAAHSDGLACTICTEPAQCTYKEKKRRWGFSQHALKACVKANANTISPLWRKNKSSHSLRIHTYCIQTKPIRDRQGKLKRPPK